MYHGKMTGMESQNKGVGSSDESPSNLNTTCGFFLNSNLVPWKYHNGLTRRQREDRTTIILYSYLFSHRYICKIERIWKMMRILLVLYVIRKISNYDFYLF
jgi:hypothetical protein